MLSDDIYFIFENNTYSWNKKAIKKINYRKEGEIEENKECVKIYFLDENEPVILSIPHKLWNFFYDNLVVRSVRKPFNFDERLKEYDEKQYR